MKKLIITLLVFSMLFTIFASGCSKKELTPTEGQTKEAGKATEKAEETKNSEPDVISVLTWDNDNASYSILGEQPVLEYAMKKTNVKVEWQLANFDEMADKVALLAAAGSNMPDLFLAPSGLKNTTPQEMAEKGVIIPFGDMIDSGKMPLTKALLSKDEFKNYKSEITEADGKIYSLSRVTNTDLLIWNMLIRKDWMDKLNITKLPETINEYTDVLRKIVKSDPNGNGQADEIGWTNFMPGTGFVSMWYPSFGINTRDYFPFFDENFGMQDGKFYFIKTDLKYKKLLEWLNMVYKEKLIDQEIFNMDSPKANAKMPVIATQHHWLQYNMVNAEQLKNDLKDEKIEYYSMLWPLAEGVSARNYVKLGQAMFPTYLAKKGKNTDAAVRFVDYLLGDSEFAKIREIGIEGVHHKVEGGKIKFIGKWADMPAADRAAALGGFTGRLPYVMLELLQTQEIDSEPKYKNIKAFLPLIKPLMKPLPIYKFTADQTNAINDATKDLKTYTDEMITGFITGKIPFSKWDEYVKKVEEMDGGKIAKAIAIYEQYYNKK